MPKIRSTVTTSILSFAEGRFKLQPKDIKGSYDPMIPFYLELTPSEMELDDVKRLLDSGKIEIIKSAVIPPPQPKEQEPSFETGKSVFGDSEEAEKAWGTDITLPGAFDAVNVEGEKTAEADDKPGKKRKK